MSRLLSTALALLVLTSPNAAQTDAPANEALKAGIKRLESAEYADALKAFDKALDTYAGARRLEDAKRAYMQLFVGNRNHANVVMKAMKVWVETHRDDAAGLPAAAFAEFDAWVRERDALAEATVNLVHNSPDWK